MGKGKWFTSMKKSLNTETEENNNQNQELAVKSKKKWFMKKKRPTTLIETPSEGATTTLTPPPIELPQVVAPPLEPPKLSGVDKEHNKHAYAVALASAKAAEAAVAAAQAAAEVVRLTATTAPPFAGMSKEIAAIKIQTIFRGFMARRKLRAMRGLMRLKRMMQGQAIKRQTENTLKTMQALGRAQTQIRERRQKMAEDNLARHKLVQQKYEREQAKELQKSQKKVQEDGDDWDSSRKTKEQIEAKKQIRHEATMRRERTMAYSYTHQQTWKSASMSAETLLMDVNNPQWGWSWLERWLVTRPWENAISPDKDLTSEKSPSIKSSKKFEHITSSYAPYFRNTTTKKPRTSISVRSSSSKESPTTQKLKSLNPKSIPIPGPKSSPRTGIRTKESDTKSTLSINSEKQSRRNSVTGSSIGDDESLTSSKTVPSYMGRTESAKARSSPLGIQRREKSVTPDRSSVSSVKKQSYSQPVSPARSRRSSSSIADINSIPEHI